MDVVQCPLEAARRQIWNTAEFSRLPSARLQDLTTGDAFPTKVPSRGVRKDKLQKGSAMSGIAECVLMKTDSAVLLEFVDTIHFRLKPDNDNGQSTILHEVLGCKCYRAHCDTRLDATTVFRS
jgi:hypothetical protein